MVFFVVTAISNHTLLAESFLTA